jgi:hypothetical protein
VSQGIASIPWHVFLLLFSLVGGWSGLLIWAIRWMLDRYIKGLDSRFDRLESRIEDESQQWKRLERELLELKVQLPERYVQREDWIRFTGKIEAKLDALAEALLRSAKERAKE